MVFLRNFNDHQAKRLWKWARIDIRFNQNNLLVAQILSGSLHWNPAGGAITESSHGHAQPLFCMWSLNLSLYLYYKKRTQLKTSVTRIGSTVLLMPDPPVICFWKWIGWKNYELPKNRNLESVSAKKLILFSLMPNLPACVYPPGPLYS
jgi:hypothetical protein